MWLWIHSVIYIEEQTFHRLEPLKWPSSPVIPEFQRVSFICDYKQKMLQYSWTRSRVHPAKNLIRYCSKIPNPKNGWEKGKRYQENEVAFVIYTGKPFYASRAKSVRDTWASRVTHYYFLSSEPDPYLPITIINNTGEDYQSNTKKIFYGLQSIYRQQQSMHSSLRHKWYVLVGCDTYIHAPHLLKQLERYNFSQPYFIGGSTGESMCYEMSGKSYKSLYVGGNTAHILSAALVEALYPHLSVYIDSVWPQPNHTAAALSDVALSCLIFSLKFNMTIVPGLWKRSPEGAIEEFGLEEVLRIKEPSSWHYVDPLQMIDLDEFYSYQFADRLKNDHNWNELTEFILLFIGTHYEILRKHYSNGTKNLIKTYR